jgi:hypothetical protein
VGLQASAANNQILSGVGMCRHLAAALAVSRPMLSALHLLQVILRLGWEIGIKLREVEAEVEAPQISTLCLAQHFS